MNGDIYRRVTDQIVLAIETGAGGYRMPWHRSDRIGAPTNAITERPYRGINSLLLWAEASRAGYASGRWATYRQWADRGSQVRAGERSTLVMLWKPLGPADPEEPGAPERQPSRHLARAFHLFNIDQVEGAPVEASSVLAVRSRIAHAEAFFEAQPARVWYGSDSAFFDPRADMVSMPSFAAFRSPECFYSVFAHELTHWTGAKARLNRDLSGRFGSDAYAMEELVAELGAAFTIGHLGLACEPRTDHAPYIASWLRVLANDPRAIVTAASRAQQAADYLIRLSQDGGANAADVAGESVGMLAVAA